jgi:hypothetical protein
VQPRGTECVVKALHLPGAAKESKYADHMY